MPLWGNTDNTSCSPLFAPAQVNRKPNSANRDLLFGNTTANAFVNGATYGVFGVSAAEMAYDKTFNVSGVTITAAGSGATARPTVAIGGSPAAGGNASATAWATAVSVTIANTGTGWTPNTTANVAGGTASSAGQNTVFNVLTTKVGTIAANSIGSGYVNGDVITLTTGTGTKANAVVTTGAANTSVASLALANAGNYTINPTNLNAEPTTNTTGVGAGLTVLIAMGVGNVSINAAGSYTAVPTTNNNVITGGGTGARANVLFGVHATVTMTANGFGYPANVNIVTISGTGLTGQTAIANLSPMEVQGIASSGWVLRKALSGQKAGRVQYETLVAGRRLTSDATDDTILPE